jgi:hypothetical protein
LVFATSIAASWNVEHNADGTHKTGPRGKAYLGTGQTIADGPLTRITLDKIVYDHFNEFNPITGLWTAREDMDVIVFAGLFIASTDTGNWYVTINQDETSTGGGATNIKSYSIDQAPVNGTTTGRQLSAVLEVKRGHSIALMAEQHTGGNQTVGAGENSTWMAIHRTR